MKYYKLIGDQNKWRLFKVGDVYKGSHNPNNNCKVKFHAKVNPDDWQEVPKPKKSLSEKIEKLKKRAEKEGMKCEVVLDSSISEKVSFTFEGTNTYGIEIKLDGVVSDKGISGSGTFKATNPKDEWEGVEFVESLEDKEMELTKGKIYKVKRIALPRWIDIDFDDELDSGNGFNPKVFKPSTENAYVEQLKAKAKELFGEIKFGDRFDLTPIDPYYEKNWPTQDSRIGFEYFKGNDKLRFMETCIYQSGKWAKKLPKRIEVDLVWEEKIMLGVEMPAVAFHDKTKYNSDGKVESIFKGKSDSEIGKSFKFLASQLEKYLNGEIE